MFTRRFGMSLVFSMVAAGRAAAQPVAVPPTHWVTIAGGFGPADGAGYKSFAERLASVALALPTGRRQIELTVTGAWHAADAFCEVSAAISCSKSGPTRLNGGTLSFLIRRGRGNGTDQPTWSTGLGAYHLPDGLGEAPPRGRVFPAVQTGVDRPIYTGDHFALLLAAHAIVVPYVHGRAFIFLPLTLGYRAW